jgi:formate hydrogenlyase transcriptional activator
MRSGLFSVPTLEEQIDSLQPGDHVCAISSGVPVVHSVVVPFVRRCLARNEMCFYAIGERAPEDVVAELSRAGIDVEQAIERGALTLLSSREYMPLEKFDPSAFLALFRARAQQALNAGFSCAAFVVEMTWGLELEIAHHALIEYEARMNTEFFPQQRAIALCIYERQRLSAEYLQAALRSHPLAIVEDKLISDPYYEPPELMARPSEGARVDWMIAQLARWAEDREQLRRSHDRLQALIENATDGITVVDAEGRIVYEGPSSVRLGYKPEELVGRYAPDFMSPEDTAPVVDKIRRAIENPEEVQTIRVRVRHPDGSFIDVEAVGRRLRDPRDPPYVVFNWRDISERVQFYDRLRERLESENAYLQEEVRAASGNGTILGKSAGVHRVLEQIEMVAPTDAAVLIVGETGVGKELVARAIHERSLRRDRPLVKINCTAIPRELFESEFFGHIKGAFSGALRDRIGRFQLADGGTLFLDEIGELPLAMQPKLLRVLQEGEFEPVGIDTTRRVDVRIIAATNRDLKSLVRAGRFREDLYYRLSVFPIEVPPLRERKDDIPLLAKHFLEAACKRFNRCGLQLAASQVKQLQNYDWAGNVRELQNVIERAVITSGLGSLRLDIPAAETRSPAPATARSKSREESEVVPDQEMSRRMRDNIAAALKRSSGRIYGPGGAAELLGIRPTTLSTRIKKLGLK